VASKVVDANDLSGFADGSFDAVTMCYGVMFVDRPKALTEIARVLEPGGAFVATYWLNHCITHLAGELLDLLGRPDLKAYRVNPMSCAEPGKLERELADAGFDRVDVVHDTYSQTFDGTYDEFFWAAIVPFKIALEKAPDPQEVKDDLMAAAKREFAAIAEARFKQPDGTYVIKENRFSLATARKPLLP